jgi:hypothetical protein
VLNGHQHNYERFFPQDPSEQRDDAYGVREFIVGTGGRSFGTHSENLQSTSEFFRQDVFGALLLTLHADGYDWEFVAIDGSVVDSGSGTCHAAPPAPTPTPTPTPTATETPMPTPSASTPVS